MKDIAIYGGGGLGREVASSIIRGNFGAEWNLIGFFDDGIPVNTEVSHFGRCLGGIREVNLWPKELNLALCFGAPKTTALVHSKIDNSHIKFPNLIDSSFYIADTETFKIGIGNIIMGGIATTNVCLGNFNLLNGDVTLGHDAFIGDFNVFMQSSKICGETKIGNRNLFGMMSFVRQGIKVGNDIILSPLSALLTNPRNGNTYIGNPAKRFHF